MSRPYFERPDQRARGCGRDRPRSAPEASSKSNSTNAFSGIDGRGPQARAQRLTTTEITALNGDTGLTLTTGTIAQRGGIDHLFRHRRR